MYNSVSNIAGSTNRNHFVISRKPCIGVLFALSILPATTQGLTAESAESTVGVTITL